LESGDCKIVERRPAAESAWARRFQVRAVDNGDPAALVSNQPGVLQLPGSLGDVFAAHPEHVGDQFLGHGNFIRCRTIQAQQQPPTQLLVDRMVPNCVS
jgi:hypothetical protein